MSDFDLYGFYQIKGRKIITKNAEYLIEGTPLSSNTADSTIVFIKDCTGEFIQKGYRLPAKYTITYTDDKEYTHNMKPNIYGYFRINKAHYKYFINAYDWFSLDENIPQNVDTLFITPTCGQPNKVFQYTLKDSILKDKTSDILYFKTE